MLSDPFSQEVVSNDLLTETTEFSVTVTDPNGCINSDTILVTVISSLTIPTAFTPDNDLINDTWDIKNIEDFASVEVVVVNGLGSEVLSTNDYKPWDGKYKGEDLSVGSYYYIIKIKTLNGEEIIKTGMVTILR